MAQLQKGTTYITGDQVTAANLNALVDSGILTPGAVTDQTAKTVPLAADTILLHSAADTALRKTTMTQLFATPQPLGATTPSSVAATTGTFSSTLGVTGVATLGNGAILGTPASGTVTNLTGTASININGTVGATTPSTIAATTVGATGIISSTSNNPSAEFGKGNGTAASVRLNPHTATYHNWSIDNGVTSSGTLNIAPSTAVGGNTYTTPVAYFTTTGLNSTAIGASSASTGAFTTLSASGTATLRDAANTYSLNVSGVGGTQIVAFGNASSVPRIQAFTAGFAATTHLDIQPAGGNTNVGGLLNVGAGAAITGTLSATGQIKSTLAYPSKNNFYSFDSATGGGSGGGYYFGSASIADAVSLEMNAVDASNANLLARIKIAGTLTTVGTFTSTGLGIGTASPATKLHVYEATNYPQIRISGTGAGADTGPNLGFYCGDSAGNPWEAGYVTVRNTSANQSSASASSYMDFYTSSSGAVSNRMRISGDGRVNIGTTTALNSGGAKASIQFSGGQGLFIATEAQGAGQVLGFNYNITTNVGSVNITSTATTYTTSSDYRLKNITGVVTDSGIFIDALKPKVGTWKVDGSKFVGFLAHEFAEVCPSAVIAEKDAVDTDGKPVYQSMQASSVEVIANLVAELQSLRKRLAALESK